MKKFLLSFLCLFLIVSYSFAQRPPCPIDIKSNQGGGNCDACGQTNPGVTAELGKRTAVITLTFSGVIDPTNIPRLLSAKDQNDSVRKVLCGEGSIKEQGGTSNTTIVEYCLYDNEEAYGTNGNFFNQPNLLVVLLNEATGETSLPCGREIGGSPLPVGLSKIAASRNKSNVSITWTTTSESNNKGFNVQRNTKGTWENIAFVFSKATDGNSSSDISYFFNDVNTNKGVTQYRLQQVDIDGKAAYSEIRSVRGEEMANKALVYPNPSTEGGVNVVFDNARGERDVLVSDMSGRVIKQWRSITDNSMRISNLQPGTYTLRIFNKQDGSQQYEKLVINR